MTLGWALLFANLTVAAFSIALALKSRQLSRAAREHFAKAQAHHEASAELYDRILALQER